MLTIASSRLLLVMKVDPTTGERMQARVGRRLPCIQETLPSWREPHRFLKATWVIAHRLRNSTTEISPGRQTRTIRAALIQREGLEKMKKSKATQMETKRRKKTSLIDDLERRSFRERRKGFDRRNPADRRRGSDRRRRLNYHFLREQNSQKTTSRPLK